MLEANPPLIDTPAHSIEQLQIELEATKLELQKKTEQLESVAEGIGLLAIVQDIELTGDDPAEHMRQFSNKYLFEKFPASNDLEHQSRHDRLTGVLNKHGFQENVQAFLNQGRRKGDKKKNQHSLVFLDLDNFKSFNTELTHGVTDTEVLIPFAQTLKDNLRPDSRIGRFGGEEFILFLPNTPADIAEVVLARIREICGEKIFEADGLKLGFTAGICEVTPGTTYEEAMARADATEGAAKNLPGKNQTLIWGDSKNWPKLN